MTKGKKNKKNKKKDVDVGAWIDRNLPWMTKVLKFVENALKYKHH